MKKTIILLSYVLLACTHKLSAMAEEGYIMLSPKKLSQQIEVPVELFNAKGRTAFFREITETPEGVEDFYLLGSSYIPTGKERLALLKTIASMATNDGKNITIEGFNPYIDGLVAPFVRAVEEAIREGLKKRMISPGGMTLEMGPYKRFIAI
jgi:hypothetical protein